MWGIICATVVGVAELWFLIKSSFLIEEAEAGAERRRKAGLPPPRAPAGVVVREVTSNKPPGGSRQKAR